MRVDGYLFLRALSCALVQVNISLLQDDIGVTATNSFNRRHGEHNFPLAIDVRTQNTKNVLKFLWDDQRLEENEQFISHSATAKGRSMALRFQACVWK